MPVPVPIPDSLPVATVDDGGPAVAPDVVSKPVLFEYEVVQGFFLQNGPKTKFLPFGSMLERSFGLIDTTPNRWSNFRRAIQELQSGAEEGVKYKVLFLGRHGQGWHNFASLKYGTEAWEAHWTFQRTDGDLVWGPDPPLTPLGLSQARAIHTLWKSEYTLGAPIKKNEMKWYVSPMTRACQTMEESFGEMLGEEPECWEDWREIIGSHTCDQRKTRSYLENRFPELKIEPSLTEEDELWTAEHRESDGSMQHRARRGLDRVFGNGPDGANQTFISLTSHSAFLRNLLAVLGHQPYPLSTGEMIPVVVKATRVQRDRDGDSYSEFGTSNGTYSMPSTP